MLLLLLNDIEVCPNFAYIKILLTLTSVVTSRHLITCNITYK